MLASVAPKACIPFLFAVVLGLIVIGSVVLTTALSGTNAVEIRAQMGFPSTEPQYIPHACACKNDWPICSDEIVRANNAQLTEGVTRNKTALMIAWGNLIRQEISFTQNHPTDGFCSLLFNNTRAIHAVQDGCRAFRNLNTPFIDGDVLYGNNDTHLIALRDGPLCELRTNVLPHGITSESPLRVLLLREHNRLCSVVRTQQPSWRETEVFWKTRQIVNVEMQIITYEEWLPHVFGTQMWMLQDDVTAFPNLGASISAEFLVGVFEPLFQSEPLFSSLEAYLEESASETFAQYNISGNALFRGRDIGLATYAQVVVGCYNSITSPGITEQELPLATLQEPFSAGSSLSQNAAIIIAEQFHRIRRYDPNFYVALGTRLGLFYEQLVQGVTLSRLIRDNTALTSMRESVFQL